MHVLNKTIWGNILWLSCLNSWNGSANRLCQDPLPRVQRDKAASWEMMATARFAPKPCIRLPAMLGCLPPVLDPCPRTTGLPCLGNETPLQQVLHHQTHFKTKKTHFKILNMTLTFLFLTALPRKQPQCLSRYHSTESSVQARP